MDWDVVIVGGGLWGGLLADRLAAARPELRTLLIEKGAHLGGLPTWSFHESDFGAAGIPDSTRELISRSWETQEVRFPGLRKAFQTRYHSIRSQDFHERVSKRLGQDRLWLGVGVAGLTPDQVALESGEMISARCVIDARGAGKLGAGARASTGYQKFVGLDVELESPHGLEGPVIMDAEVDQIDGYRFIYLLPWSERELLIEDTRYSDGPEIDQPAFEVAIRQYAENQGWKIRTVKRREAAALPIPRDPRFCADSDHRQANSLVPAIGMRAGHFHPTTGYSVCYALPLIESIVALPRIDTASVREILAQGTGEIRSQRGFFLFLNRMLFRASPPELRYRVFRRFYENPDSLVFRFYSGRLGSWDRARVFLGGKPPVPVMRGLRCLFPNPSKERTS